MNTYAYRNSFLRLLKQQLYLERAPLLFARLLLWLESPIAKPRGHEAIIGQSICSKYGLYDCDSRRRAGKPYATPRKQFGARYITVDVLEVAINLIEGSPGYWKSRHLVQVVRVMRLVASTATEFDVEREPSAGRNREDRTDHSDSGSSDDEKEPMPTDDDFEDTVISDRESDIDIPPPVDRSWLFASLEPDANRKFTIFE